MNENKILYAVVATNNLGEKNIVAIRPTGVSIAIPLISPDIDSARDSYQSTKRTLDKESFKKLELCEYHVKTTILEAEL